MGVSLDSISESPDGKIGRSDVIPETPPASPLIFKNHQDDMPDTKQKPRTGWYPVDFPDFIFNSEHVIKTQITRTGERIRQ